MLDIDNVKDLICEKCKNNKFWLEYGNWGIIISCKCKYCGHDKAKIMKKTPEEKIRTCHFNEHYWNIEKTKCNVCGTKYKEHIHA